MKYYNLLLILMMIKKRKYLMKKKIILDKTKIIKSKNKSSQKDCYKVLHSPKPNLFFLMNSNS